MNNKEQLPEDPLNSTMELPRPEEAANCISCRPILVQRRSAGEREQEGDETSNGSPVDNLIVIGGSDLTDATLKSCHILNPALRTDDPRVMFFDLDNTLYSISTGIAHEMGHRIELFFQEYLHLPRDDALTLGRKFYLDYGLAIKGLIKHFSIDPQQYDDFVDGGLKLEEVLQPNKKLKNIISRIKARRWVFTNAGLKHALRVLQLLGLQDQFEGIIYCDYSEPNFPAKPDRLAYERAMRCVGVTPERCYFVDDGVNNVRTAVELGWKAVLLDELGEFEKSPATGITTITYITALESVFGDIFQ